jgi:hypothetical protein
MLAEMARRGAHIDDFPATLDRYIAAMPRVPAAQVRTDYAKFERFYFRWVKDPARQAAFRARLGEGTVTP